MPWPYEKGSIFPNEVIGDAFCQTLDHFPKGMGGRRGLGERPFARRLVGIELREGGKGRLRAARLRIF